MVQRKQTRKLGSKTEKPKRQLSSHQQQDTGSKGGEGDLMKKMKHPLPLIRALDGSPNYMKATSSSHARKEQLQVTVHSPITTTVKNRNPKLSNNSNFSKCPSPSLDGSGIKQVRSLTRDSSLKPVRSSMKKSSGMGLYLKKNVDRATCSSTLKDSKFPRALDLNPGGTESEGASIMRVCPYNHCSLNGHTHESVPLKSFLSARRQLVKNQRSMKLRRLSSLLAISSTPSGLEINPLFEDADNDFFVDIYAKPQSQIKQVESFKERSIQGKHGRENILDESSLMEDDWECTVNQIYETSSDINYKDDLDLTSNLSNEEMDVLINSLEYVECDPKFELKEAHPCLMAKGYADWDSDCYTVNASSNNNKSPAKSETNVSTSIEAIDKHRGVDSFQARKTDDSEYLNDGFGPIFDPLLEIENASDGWSPVLLHEDEVTDNSDGTSSSTILSYGLYEKHGKDGIEDDSSILEVHFTDSPHGYTEAAHNMPEFDCIELEMEMEACKCDYEVEHLSVLENHNNISNDQSDESNIGKNQEKLDHERQEEIKDTDRSISKPSKEYSTGLKETLKIREDIISDVYGTYFEANINSAAEDGTFSTPALTSAHLAEAVSSPKARYNMIRRKTTEKVQEIRAFNPQPPRFLLVEDDQEAEKVDLRHQPADERKTAEEWMIDYALQQAVMKLAPDRKRKVELLVEAFETIMPLPICETTMLAISSLTHARPMQACS